MKILYVGAFRLPRYDAAAARVLSIAYPLKKLGHEVSFISWGGKYDDDEIVLSDGFHQNNDIRYLISDEIDAIGLKNKIFQRLIRGNKSLKAIENLKPDAVIAYNTPWSFNKGLLKLSARQGFKVIADITEWYDNNELWLTDIIPNWINMHKTYPRFPNKILISSFLDKFYKKSHNLVIPALCNSHDSKWRNLTSGFNSEKIRLIYAGNPAKKDKVHTVIDVVNKLYQEGSNLEFNILGISKEDYIRLYSKLLRYEMSDAIIFHGKVSQDIIPQYYANSDFMVLLRDNTRKSNAGFPTKFAEAIMSGTPVIANSTSDIAKYLIDGKNGFLLDSSDFESLYDTLKDRCLTLSENEKKEMKQYVINKSKSQFECSSYINQLSEFLDNLK